VVRAASARGAHLSGATPGREPGDESARRVPPAGGGRRERREQRGDGNPTMTEIKELATTGACPQCGKAVRPVPT